MEAIIATTVIVIITMLAIRFVLTPIVVKIPLLGGLLNLFIWFAYAILIGAVVYYMFFLVLWILIIKIIFDIILDD